MGLDPRRYAHVTCITATAPLRCARAIDAKGKSQRGGEEGGAQATCKGIACTVKAQNKITGHDTPSVYVIELKGGYVYVGKSTNVKRRVKQHMDGMGARFTRKHKPTGKLIARMGVLQVSRSDRPSGFRKRARMTHSSSRVQGMDQRGMRRCGRCTGVDHTQSGAGSTADRSTRVRIWSTSSATLERCWIYAGDVEGVDTLWLRAETGSTGMVASCKCISLIAIKNKTPGPSACLYLQHNCACAR